MLPLCVSRGLKHVVRNAQRHCHPSSTGVGTTRGRRWNQNARLGASSDHLTSQVLSFGSFRKWNVNHSTACADRFPAAGYDGDHPVVGRLLRPSVGKRRNLCSIEMARIRRWTKELWITSLLDVRFCLSSAKTDILCFFPPASSSAHAAPFNLVLLWYTVPGHNYTLPRL